MVNQGSIANIRHQFIQYYQDKGFIRLPRASMLHPSIPMSFVMSAGLVQVEMALSQLPKPQDSQKFVLVQDCFRHFDLDRVGQDHSHLSIFEMPGAFLFGHNTKKDTIHLIWEFTTKILKINQDHLWVSYFAGDEVNGHILPPDQETYQIWYDLGVNPKHLIGLGSSDNYWLQSPHLTRENKLGQKCGENTEIFYDLGITQNCHQNCNPTCSCGRFLEFSNSLFITSQIHEDTGNIVSWEHPFTETVIGAERVAMILQNAKTVFDLEEYRILLDAIRKYQTVEYLPDQTVLVSQRILIDHLRALYMLIANGAPPPGKNGRSRIIKLLIRRVITHMQVLQIPETNTLHFLTIISQTFHVYNVSSYTVINTIMDYFDQESQRFHFTIERGYKKLEEICKFHTEDSLFAAEIVKLEKTFGMPLALIQKQLIKHDLDFNWHEYQKALHNWQSMIALSRV